MNENSQRPSIAFDHRRHFETVDNENDVPGFGHPNYNHGWIECISTSFPGQAYYFNVDTRCSTWHRPVSRFVPTHSGQPVRLMSDEDYSDNAPIVVSEDGRDKSYIQAKNNRQKIVSNISSQNNNDEKSFEIIANSIHDNSKNLKNDAEVLFKLYHCTNRDYNCDEIIDVNRVKREQDDENSNDDDYCAIIPETCYSSDSNDSSKNEEEFVRKRRSYENSEDRDSFDDVFQKDEDRYEKIDDFDNRRGSNIGKIKNWENSSNYCSLMTPKKWKNDFPTIKRKIDDRSLCDDDDEDLDNSGTTKKVLFSLPRLKAIESTDLAQPSTIEVVKKLKKRKITTANREKEKKSSSKRFTMIVCNVNGVTTVNYDYLPPELPNGIIVSNLSDSGSSRGIDADWTLKSDNANDKSANEKNADVVAESHEHLADFGELNLSDSSDSS